MSQLGAVGWQLSQLQPKKIGSLFQDVSPRRSPGVSERLARELIEGPPLPCGARLT